MAISEQNMRTAMQGSSLGYLLIVDDNEMNRDLMSRRLRREGYATDVAEDGYRAMEMIQKNAYDLILLDIMMPGLSGFDMLPMIRALYDIAELPVIMATAKDQSEDIVEGLRLGANDYVTKPIDHPVLLARIQLHLKMRQLAKLKDEFVRIASHDLKNPLSTVMMAAHIVRERVPPGSMMQEQFHQMLTYITRHSEEMQRIIRDFLDFQALEDGALSIESDAFNLSEAAQMLLQENSTYAESKQIALTSRIDPVLPVIQADGARIRQVGQNLVGNAIKFCPEGSTVIIRTRREGQQAVFEVTDDGPGLTASDFQKVFNKYSRLSNQPTGGEKSTGLGLAICKQFIELHSGTIGVFNNPERGATFWFKLPII